MDSPLSAASLSTGSDAALSENERVTISKSEQIQELVQKMKAGSISKSELFTKLSLLQKQSRAPPTLHTSDEQTTDQEGYSDVDEIEPILPMQPTESVSDRRSVIIQRLFDQKRQQVKQTQEASLDSYLSTRDQVPFFQKSDSSKMQRLQEESYQKQMEECTFKPKIKRLPQEYGVRTEQSLEALSFDERMIRWKERKSKDNERKRIEKAKEELQGCTFRPNTKSKSVGPVEAVGERLFEESKKDKLSELQARAKAEDEERLRKECTFTPNTTLTKGAIPVRSRYKTPLTPSAGRRTFSDVSSVTSSSSSVRRKSTGYEDCTFTPKINPVHPSMEAAQVYLSNGIFDRLTQSREDIEAKIKYKENQDRTNDKVIDVETFLSSMNSDGSLQKRPSSAPRQIPCPSPKISEEERRAKKKNFETFLARQQQSQIRKEKKMEQVLKQTQPSGSPALCKKSNEIVKHYQGSFLQRVAKDAIRKEHDKINKKSQYQDPECTFKPQITKSAQKLPSRSAVEMSRGDSLRKETNARLLKLRDEQEKLEGLTFAPEVYTSSNKGESKLKIMSDPDTYLARLHHKNLAQSHRQLKAAQEQEMKELQECTFKPEIHEAPNYVKQIVQSLALARPTKEEEEAIRMQVKPDWK